MKIIIVGDGKVGFTLAEHLSREEHDVTIIDTSDNALQKASDTLDVMCIKGNGASLTALKEAGADTADLLIAVTNLDEVNMVCCLTGKRLGAKYTIARVRNFEYTAAQGMLKMGMGIDLLINPENDTAVEISRILRFPSAANIETFYRGRVELMSFRAREEDFFIGQPLSALSRKVRDLPILFCAAERNEEVLIPDGSFVPQVGDKLYLIGAPLGLHGFFELMGRYAPKIRNVFVVGGGRITFYLAALMERMNMKVTIVERKEERCRQLSELLPHTLVINGDGTDQELLESENMAANDAFVALTDRDEDNLIISLYALQKGLKKVVAKCNRQNYTGIVQHLGLDSVISPKLITAGHILQVVRGMQNSKGSVMNALYRIAEGGAEAAEFAVNGTTRHLHTPLKDLRLKRGVLIAVIIHQGQVIIPVGSSVISSGDTVIIISRGMGILDVNDIYDESGMEADG
ncbi:MULTISPECIES: Trk system potassium transporter TrkA [Intestinimonas]|uniref:Trk system potassium uptake protein TrkA n=1 Tax=Intestinimonas massiliensis (ex Afouda et al. 2020) TaxID=1673721 RepID=A0AAW5JS76_9FIRM|nr:MULTISPECIES: Trk system potassium transporter TrkA [Intestinimonas]MBS6282023.1 Trk system potassium transporter TrkA [Oscillospiraceae bacterium]MDU1324585.1 Trk system potassium transporter TrkA [Clostridiales bacterium]CUQ09124.1 potassium transporter peripheral membrane component [Flavonifractor plautii]SCI97123.1 Trk system potassium uptake protein trkA [uncultured Flavonifractor sp.]MCG4526540.1 Trk system potassium transporter TrkA [Intestinimonas massiliensis (ex Afouda et al. 2020